jgi:tRNA/rRNA methyltransferase
MKPSTEPEMIPSAVLPAPTFDRVRVVLCRPSHPGNIGSAARAMKTMGFSRLVLVAPKQFPDPQAETMAAGATDVLDSACVVSTLAEALEGTVLATALTSRRRELAVAPLWAREAAQELAQEIAQGEVALVFGNETYGLSNDELALCARWAMIPANPESPSLNLAAAVQLLSYELRLALMDPGVLPVIPDAGVPANHEDVERLINHLQQVALDSGFLDPAAPKRFVPRMRRLFARARIEREELNILRGLLAATQKRS